MIPPGFGFELSLLTSKVLDFKYPQYFNRLFKQKTGKTPLEYRNMN